MPPMLFSRIVLALSGLTALFVSLSIFLDTVAFYAGYGIEPGTSTSLLSELKAPAGGMLFLGFLALAGAGVLRLTRVATWAVTVFYASYGASRVVSLVFDGLPGTETVVALGTEVLLGLLGLAALLADRRYWPGGGSQSSTLFPSGSRTQANLP